MRQRDREQNENVTRSAKRGDSKTSMGIALTLLAAGIIVQLLAGLGIFGQRSVIPLMIGGIVIIIGLCIVLVMRRTDAAHKNSKGNSER